MMVAEEGQRAGGCRDWDGAIIFSLSSLFQLPLIFSCRNFQVNLRFLHSLTFHSLLENKLGLGVAKFFFFLSFGLSPSKIVTF